MGFLSGSSLHPDEIQQRVAERDTSRRHSAARTPTKPGNALPHEGPKKWTNNLKKTPTRPVSLKIHFYKTTVWRRGSQAAREPPRCASALGQKQDVAAQRSKRRSSCKYIYIEAPTVAPNYRCSATERYCDSARAMPSGTPILRRRAVKPRPV